MGTIRPGSGAVFLAVMWLGYCVYAIDRSVLGVVLAPMSESLSLSGIEVGLMGSAQYMGVLAVVLVAGHVSDLIGRRRVVLAGVAVFTAFTWLVAFASTFPEAFVFRFVSGLGEGLFWPVAMAAVASYFGSRKGLTLGLFYVGFDVGAIGGTTIGGTAYALFGGWQAAFLVAPLLGIPVLVGVLFAKDQFASGDAASVPVRLGRDALGLVRTKGVPALLVFAFLATAATVWQNVYLAYYFQKVIHMSVFQSGFMAAILFAGGAFGKVILGGGSDRWRRNRLLAAVSAGVVVSYWVFFTTSNVYAAAATEVAMGFLSASIFPVMQALMADFGGAETGTALGLTTTSQSLATVIWPVLTSAVFGMGVGTAIVLVAMLPSVCMFFVALVVKDPRPASNP
jgi:MFS family permease